MTVVEVEEIGRLFRLEAGRAVATLARVFRSIDIAEEAAVQEALLSDSGSW